MKTLKEHREEEAVTQQQTENVVLFHEWIKKHPKVRDCDAVYLAFTEFMDDDVWTEADLEYALSRIPESRLITQRVKSEAEVVAEENARRKALPIDELKALARAEMPKPVAPTLPMEFEGHNIADAKSLMALSKTDFNSFKRLNKKFGSELINQRLGVKPTAKTGVNVRLPL